MSRSARAPRSGSPPPPPPAPPRPAGRGGGAGGLDGQRGRVGAGEREDGVAVAEELGDDGGADQAGATGDKDVHGTPLKVMGLLSRDTTRVMKHRSHHL